MMSSCILLLGDQLFADLPGMPRDCPIFMREDRFLATRVRHHQQKLVLFFSAMRHFAKESGRTVTYQKFDRADSRTYFEAFSEFLREKHISSVHIYRIADQSVAEAWEAWTSCERELHGLQVTWVDNPMFLTQNQDWQSYRQGSKRLLMGEFYAFQRRRLGILLEENGEPTGGKWSFDAENRKALPKMVLPPPVTGVAPDEITREVISLIKQEFPSHPGNASSFEYAVTHSEVSAWLDAFLRERLSRFGEYEDAIPQRERTLFHGVLTPYLNCGLLTPDFIVRRTIEFAQEQKKQGREIPLNSLEGFLRQVIGWREFIFWMDREYAQRQLNPNEMNFFGHHRKLGAAWWNGTTGLPPLDTVIRRAEEHAYCHHIERLMVVGAAMLMSEVAPSEAYRWFMEMFIDSTDWVMVPNVMGMSQFADGGVFATKPYLSGSAYILKMSDYSKGPWCDVWDGLYWSFIERNREFFRKNPRMATMTGGLDRLEPSRKERIFIARDQFVSRVTSDS